MGYGADTVEKERDMIVYRYAHFLYIVYNNRTYKGDCHHNVFAEMV